MIKRVVTVPQITEAEALKYAQIMASDKKLGELKRFSETEWRTNGGSATLFIQSPDNSENKYNDSFRPVYHEYGYCNGEFVEINKQDRVIMPPDAYRIGWIDNRTNSTRLIGYVWSNAKAQSLEKEWRTVKV